MKFVIWGAGIRGKRAAEFIGYNNVVSFVDSDNKLIGTSYAGIPIEHYEALSELCKDCLLVISPVECEDIIKIVLEKNIAVYFLFNECPAAISRGKVGKLQEISLVECESKKTIIFGSSLYSMLLWKEFQNRGYDFPIFVNRDIYNNKSIFGIKSDRIYDEENLAAFSFDTIIQTTKYIPDMLDKKVVDLYHIDKRVKKFYHFELCKFKNIGKGKRCFIVGNGSSISIADLNKLDESNEICFGTNGIPLIFHNTPWRPTYYVCEDSKAIELFGDMVLDSKMRYLFFSDVNSTFLDKAKNKRNINVFHAAVYDYFPDIPSFSSDIELGVDDGRTVTYICMQIAVYMGYQEIYLLGIDFDYEDGDTTQVKHFASNYHVNSKKINPCMKTENLLAYQAARQYADSNQIKICNATRGGKLEVFERVQFDELF